LLEPIGDGNKVSNGEGGWDGDRGIRVREGLLALRFKKPRGRWLESGSNIGTGPAHLFDLKSDRREELQKRRNQPKFRLRPWDLAGQRAKSFTDLGQKGCE